MAIGGITLATGFKETISQELFRPDLAKNEVIANLTKQGNRSSESRDQHTIKGIPALI